MTHWMITWFDGMNVRVTPVYCDVYGLANTLSSVGIYNMNGILKIERIPQP